MLGSENGSFNVIKYRQGVVQGGGGFLSRFTRSLSSEEYPGPGQGERAVLRGAFVGTVEAVRWGRPQLRGAGQGQPLQPGARSREGSCSGTAGPCFAAGSGGPAVPSKGRQDRARGTASEHLRIPRRREGMME